MHEHLAVGDRPQFRHFRLFYGHDHRASLSLEAGRQFLIRNTPPVNGHHVDQADEAVARAPLERRADPDIVIVDYRRIDSVTVRIPFSLRRPAVDPSVDGLRFSKLIRHCHMMPSGGDVKRRVRGPAMPVEDARP